MMTIIIFGLFYCFNFLNYNFIIDGVSGAFVWGKQANLGCSKCVCLMCLYNVKQ